MRANHSSSTPPRCKTAPRISYPDTIQPLTLADRTHRVEALWAILSALAFQAKVRLLNQAEGDRP